ncbi:Hypothetical predicted protein [Octopus vulgaris]|uniref:Uncharacterized protein n=1 Tax=Octopus vulgaris TaxID=6645 RepID=A0AA36BUR4_OCTVU|nr:Hypothetical predicted protein [Octopus vulgaris]
MAQWLECLARNHEVVSSISRPGCVLCSSARPFISRCSSSLSCRNELQHHWCQTVSTFVFRLDNISVQREEAGMHGRLWVSINNFARTCASEGNYLGATPGSFMTEVGIFTFYPYYVGYAVSKLGLYFVINTLPKILN